MGINNRLAQDPDTMNAAQRRQAVKDADYLDAVCGQHWIGDLVKIRIASLHRDHMTVAGTIKRVMPDGRFEIKTQLHGYYTVKPSEIVS